MRVRRPTTTLVKRFAALPLWLRLSVIAIFWIMVLPWAVRAYSAWIDLVWGRPCVTVETFAPRIVP